MKLTTHINLEPPVEFELPAGDEPVFAFDLLFAFNLSAQLRPHVGYFFPPLE